MFIAGPLATNNGTCSVPPASLTVNGSGCTAASASTALTGLFWDALVDAADRTGRAAPMAVADGGSSAAPSSPPPPSPRPPVVPGITSRLRRDDVLDVTMESLAYRGDGLAWAPGSTGEAALAISVKHAIPGDTVRVAL